MGQARKKYTQEYKDEAVELVISSGRPIAEIARDLGIYEGTLGNWVHAAKKSGKLKDKPLDTDERAELRELREETGLDAVCSELIGWVERIGDDHHFVIFDFAVTVLDDGEPVAGDDAAEARWVPLHEVTDLALVDGLAEFLADHAVIELLA